MQGKTPTGHSQNAGSENAAGYRWCLVYQTTAHSDTECYVQGAPRPQTGSAYTVAMLIAAADKNPTVNFDNDFDKGIQAFLINRRRRIITGSMSKSIIGCGSIVSTRNRRNDASRGHCNTVLRTAGISSSGIVSILFAGAVGAPRLSDNSSNMESPER